MWTVSQRYLVEISCFLVVFTEDLMSLLDADIHSAHPSVIIDADAMFSEDISYFGYPSFRRSSLSRLSSSRGKEEHEHTHTLIQS